jgi:hypothetical protein
VNKATGEFPSFLQKELKILASKFKVRREEKGSTWLLSAGKQGRSLGI